MRLLRRLLFRARGWIFCSCGAYALDARERDKLWFAWDGTAHGLAACGPEDKFKNWPIAEMAVGLNPYSRGKVRRQSP